MVDINSYSTMVIIFIEDTDMLRYLIPAFQVLSPGPVWEHYGAYGGINLSIIQICQLYQPGNFTLSN